MTERFTFPQGGSENFIDGKEEYEIGGKEEYENSDSHDTAVFKPFPDAAAYAKTTTHFNEEPFTGNLESALVLSSSFWPEYEKEGYRNTLYPQTALVAVAKQKVGLISYETMLDDFNNKHNPFKLALTAGTTFLGFRLDVADQDGSPQTFTLLREGNHEHAIAMECAVVLIFAAYRGQKLDKEGCFIDYGPRKQKETVQAIAGYLSTIGYSNAVGSLNSVNFLLKKALDNKETFDTIANHVACVLDETHNATGAINGNDKPTELSEMQLAVGTESAKNTEIFDDAKGETSQIQKLENEIALLRAAIQEREETIRQLSEAKSSSTASDAESVSADLGSEDVYPVQPSEESVDGPISNSTSTLASLDNEDIVWGIQQSAFELQQCWSNVVQAVRQILEGCNDSVLDDFLQDAEKLMDSVGLSAMECDTRVAELKAKIERLEGLLITIVAEHPKSSAIARVVSNMDEREANLRKDLFVLGVFSRSEDDVQNIREIIADIVYTDESVEDIRIRSRVRSGRRLEQGDTHSVQSM